jgi:hypothetical protein
MTGSAPLARRNLLVDPRRLAASPAGVELAVMLMLLFDGLWSGIRTPRWFCSAHCRDEFVAEPDRFPFLAKVAAP